MKPFLYALRFYGIVMPVPRLLVVSFGILTAATLVAMAVNEAARPHAVVPVIVLQVFAASAGFAVPARRGHYDVLLTGGVGRVRTALAHWVMSIAPGVAAVLVLTIGEAALAGDAWAVRSRGTWTALCLVSTVPWAFTVALPRFAAAIGWLLLCVMAATLTPQAMLRFTIAQDPVSRSTWPGVATVILMPTHWVGLDVSAHGLAAAVSLGLAGASMAVALAWIARTDFPLEASQ